MLSCRNSAVLRGKAKVNISGLWVGGNCNELKINEWCLVKKGPLSRGICSLKALRLNFHVLAYGCSFQEWEPVILVNLLCVFLPRKDTQISCSRSYWDGFASIMERGGKLRMEIFRRVRPARCDEEERAAARELGKDILKITL